MSVDNFIPEIWAGEILANLDVAHVFGQAGVVNRDYEGEISAAGDTVRINQLGRVTNRAYNPAVGLADPDVLTSSQQTLLIDQIREFNFQIGDVDRAQTTPKLLQRATLEAAYSLDETSDKFISALMVAGASGAIGTNAAPRDYSTTNTFYDDLVDAYTKLDEANIPEAGRFAIVHPAGYALLKKDVRFVASGSEMSSNVLRNGVVGEAAGLRVLKSNNVGTFTGNGTTTFTNRKVLVGHGMGASFAEQLREVEGYRPDKFISDAVRGLHLYGAKVVQPTALVVVSVKV